MQTIDELPGIPTPWTEWKPLYHSISLHSYWLRLVIGEYNHLKGAENLIESPQENLE